MNDPTADTDPQIPDSRHIWGEDAPDRRRIGALWVVAALLLAGALIGPLLYLRHAAGTADAAYTTLDTYARSAAEHTPVDATVAATVATAVVVANPDGTLTLRLRGDTGCWQVTVGDAVGYQQPTRIADDLCR